MVSPTLALCTWTMAPSADDATVLPPIHGDAHAPAMIPLLSAPRDDEQVRRELAQVEARMAQDRAELLLQGGRAEDAAEALAGARAVLLPFRDHAPVRADLERIDGLIRAIHERSGSDEAVAAGAGRAADRTAAERARDAVQAYARNVLHERVARIRALADRGQMELALAECRRLLDGHAGEPEAERLFAQLLAAAHEQRRLDERERDDELLQETRERIARSMIPSGFDGRLAYPDDWSERNREPRTPLDAPTELPPWQTRLLERLAERVGIAVDQVDAVDVLNALAHQNSINLVIDPSLLTGARKTVTLRASAMTLQSILSWICRQIDSSWTLTKGAVYVGGQEEREPVLAVYDIGDVVFQVVDQARPPPMGLASGYGGAGRGGAANANQIPTAMGGEATPVVGPEDLVDHLQKAVSPETWAMPEYGITIRGTMLIVTAPPHVHLLIREFIRSMSHANRRMVRVDARWLRIDDGYLEEIGVEWGSGPQLRPIGVADLGYHRATGEFDHSGSLLNRLPGVAVAPNPATFGTGLTLNSTMVAATQLSAILTAVERASAATVLVEPNVVTISGVRATTRIGNELSYISDYEVGTGGGNGLSPALGTKTSVVTTGGTLDVKPFVSSDGKYVFMEFASALTTLDDFTQLTIQSVRTFPTGFNPAGNGGIGAPITQTMVNDFTIEAPNVMLNEVHTYVEIPDGGSLLVGGFSNHVEQFATTGVPFLSHLPFLGRLFGQRGRYSNRSKLCLLVSVQVIDHEELERQQ